MRSVISSNVFFLPGVSGAVDEFYSSERTSDSLSSGRLPYLYPVTPALPITCRLPFALRTIPARLLILRREQFLSDPVRRGALG